MRQRRQGRIILQAFDMKTVTKTILLLLSLSVLLAACVRESVPEVGGTPDGWVISFCTAPSADVVVSTKSTMTNTKSESVVYNLYVMVFDSNGSKVYGKFFDYNNIDKSATPAPDTWKYTDEDTLSEGKIHLKSATSGSSQNCKIIVIANLNAEMVNVTPQQLDHVGSWDAMRGVMAELLQKITSRSGYFPMCGMIEHADLSDATIAFYDNDKHEHVVTDPTLTLERLDAKIQFNVQVAEGSSITRFTPMKWRVVNLPRFSYVVEGAVSASEEFFDWPADNGEANFETQTSGSGTFPVHGFSFYMLENRRANPDKTTWVYVDREGKDENGNPYAPEYATYVVMTGRVEIDNYVPAGTTDSPTTLHADVKYIVHLGDFGDSDTSTDKLGNFTVERNHSYTYNVFINGIEDIRVEVQNTGHPENEPGATGSITISQEDVLICDSHYSSHVIDFHPDKIDPDKITWYVCTPFVKIKGKSEGPDANTETYKVDSEWVDFIYNDLDAPGGNYSNKRKVYYPRNGADADKAAKTKTVSQLVAYLKSQKEKYNYDIAHWTDDGFKPTSDFDHAYASYTDENTFTLNDLDVFKANAKISVTAFVNEYFYEKDPNDPDAVADPTLWKKFVNQPMRTMDIIFSGVEHSPDNESHVTGSTFSIHQRSIQSVYNIKNEELKSGWGAETIYDEGEKKAQNSTSYSDNGMKGSTDEYNGRINSLLQWQFTKGNGSATNPYLFDASKTFLWNNYLNEEAANGEALVKKLYPFYSCLSRNRDNDGDGKISKDEIRWYTAASNQLISLFVGGNGIEKEARLYQRSESEQASNTYGVWRQHLLASNKAMDSGNPRVIWTEEGMTGSHYGNDGTYRNNSGVYDVRCVRNFGVLQDGVTDINSDENAVPDALIQIYRYELDGGKYTKKPYSGTAETTYSTSEYYYFDCTRVNPNSLRYYTNRELVQHDENGEASNLYEVFQTAAAVHCPEIPTENPNPRHINIMNSILDGNNGPNPYCPEGYRLPNVREATVIYMYLTQTERNGFIDMDNGGSSSHAQDTRIFTRTYWSFGGEGNKKASSSWGYMVNKTKLMICNYNGANNQQAKHIRCVRDLDTPDR